MLLPKVEKGVGEISFPKEQGPFLQILRQKRAGGIPPPICTPLCGYSPPRRASVLARGKGEVPGEEEGDSGPWRGDSPAPTESWEGHPHLLSQPLDTLRGEGGYFWEFTRAHSWVGRWDSNLSLNPESGHLICLNRPNNWTPTSYLPTALGVAQTTLGMTLVLETAKSQSGPAMIFSTPQPWPRGVCHLCPLWGLVKD